jgi:hypothetical protein
MGTRSDIIVKRANGTFTKIYCHWDGYLSNNGRILLEHYTTQEKCEALVDLGGISSLGEEIGEKHDFDYSMKLDRNGPEYARIRSMCNVYGRDRGETGNEGEDYPDLLSAFNSESNEYSYFWIDGQWYVSSRYNNRHSVVLLSEAVARDAEENEDDITESPDFIEVPFHGVSLRAYSLPVEVQS